MLHHTQLPQSFHTAFSILASAFFSYVKYASEASLLILTSWFVPHSLHYEHLALISLIRVQNKFTQKLFQLCWSCLCNLQTSRSFQILAFYSKHLHLFIFFFNYSLGSRDEQNLGRVCAEGSNLPNTSLETKAKKECKMELPSSRGKQDCKGTYHERVFLQHGPRLACCFLHLWIARAW